MKYDTFQLFRKRKPVWKRWLEEIMLLDAKVNGELPTGVIFATDDELPADSSDADIQEYLYSLDNVPAKGVLLWNTHVLDSEGNETDDTTLAFYIFEKDDDSEITVTEANGGG